MFSIVFPHNIFERMLRFMFYLFMYLFLWKMFVLLMVTYKMRCFILIQKCLYVLSKHVYLLVCFWRMNILLDICICTFLENCCLKQFAEIYFFVRPLTSPLTVGLSASLTVWCLATERIYILSPHDRDLLDKPPCQRDCSACCCLRCFF